MLRGDNFLIEVDGDVVSGGFTTVRWVRAKTKKEAETKAIELVKNDDRLLNSIDVESNSELMIYVEETDIDSWWGLKKAIAYIFFSTERDGHESSQAAT